jgi:hypothetical protein
MNTRISRAVTIAAAIIFIAAMANAQPPAQGPQSPTQNALTLEGSGLTQMLVNSTNQGVATANANLAANQSKHATISWSYDTWFPYVAQTQYKDRPNEFYVNKSYILTFNVDNISTKEGGVWVPYPFSRTISQSIDIHILCEGWQTGKGALTYNVIFQPAYLDPDHSILEDFLGADFIPNYVDSQIRQAMTFPGGTQVIQTGQACYSLGVPSPPADAYAFDLQPTHRVSVLPVPEISIRVMSVTRLALHNRYGVLYEVLETPHLDLWAFWSRLHLDLPSMVEGQTVVPATNAVIRTPVPGDNGQLVLIADMTYDGLPQEDSAFAVFGKSSNFGNGTQKLTTPKTWWEPPSDLTHGKPIMWTGDGYQVILEISSPTNRTNAPILTAPSTPVSTGRPVGTVGTVHP